MNSEVIKVVAGGGKTTVSEKILKEKSNGLYLAFNNSVVDELRLKGYICKTVDSLFSSFIIPKFTSLIPIIGNGSKISFVEAENLNAILKGVGNFSIDEEGYIWNQNSKTEFNLNISNELLHNLHNKTNLTLVKFIFGKNELKLTHKLRTGLSSYLIAKYPNEIIDILSSRFSYVIFDESQDLKKHLEKLAILIYNSEIQSFFLGDSFQNINGGGEWFYNLQATKTLYKSYRCPENNCKWIRDNLGITIYGNEIASNFEIIKFDEVSYYDNGDRVLLYSSASGKVKKIIENWSGVKYTIKTSKGKTINKDIVIVGDTMNKKCYYTAITRTTRNVFSTIKRVT